MRDPGIEPGSVPWQGTILPLNQPRFRILAVMLNGPYLLYISCCQMLKLNVVL